ncbi:hypothetical protein [Candidatus Lariskella endosymbiont of Epinotia ramella]|uniref:hypothetical protein n=1 Tax=Candidatus Lariskella endosymbiont of Epinotia ramella TaxID=3066224 RepID=UPI0030CF7EFB
MLSLIKSRILINLYGYARGLLKKILGRLFLTQCSQLFRRVTNYKIMTTNFSFKITTEKLFTKYKFLT